MIDVLSFLEASGIDYRTHGNNVARGDINICCPFCGDTNFHMGIDIETIVIHCWICNFVDIHPRPRLVDVIGNHLHIGKGEVFDLMKPFDILPEWRDHADRKKMKEQIKRPEESKFPEGVQSFDTPVSHSQRGLALDYLKGRGFGWTEIDKYDLKFCTNGLYRYRIMIPVYFNGKMAGFTGRDYMNREGESRYKHCKYELTSMTNDTILYGYDFYVKRRLNHLRIVEGPTDVWRMGDSAVAGMRNKLSLKQIHLIVGLKPSTVSIIFDYGSYDKAYRVGSELSAFIDKIKVVQMPSAEKDVGACTPQEVVDIEDATNYMRF